MNAETAPAPPAPDIKKASASLLFNSSHNHIASAPHPAIKEKGLRTEYATREKNEEKVKVL